MTTSMSLHNNRYAFLLIGSIILSLSSGAFPPIGPPVWTVAPPKPVTLFPPRPITPLPVMPTVRPPFPTFRPPLPTVRPPIFPPPVIPPKPNDVDGEIDIDNLQQNNDVIPYVQIDRFTTEDGVNNDNDIFYVPKYLNFHRINFYTDNGDVAPNVPIKGYSVSFGDNQSSSKGRLESGGFIFTGDIGKLQSSDGSLRQSNSVFFHPFPGVRFGSGYSQLSSSTLAENQKNKPAIKFDSRDDVASSIFGTNIGNDFGVGNAAAIAGSSSRTSGSSSNSESSSGAFAGSNIGNVYGVGNAAAMAASSSKTSGSSSNSESSSGAFAGSNIGNVYGVGNAAAMAASSSKTSGSSSNSVSFSGASAGSFSHGGETAASAQAASASSSHGGGGSSYSQAQSMASAYGQHMAAGSFSGSASMSNGGLSSSMSGSISSGIGGSSSSHSMSASLSHDNNYLNSNFDTTKLNGGGLMEKLILRPDFSAFPPVTPPRPIVPQPQIPHIGSYAINHGNYGSALASTNLHGAFGQGNMAMNFPFSSYQTSMAHSGGHLPGYHFG